MCDNTEFAAVLGEPFCYINSHPLLDIVKNLLIARFIADDQQPQAIVLQYIQGRARHISLGVARPDNPELADFTCELLNTRQVVGQRIVVEEELFYLRKGLLRPGQFLDHVPNTAGTIIVAADCLWPKAKRATRFASTAGVERNVSVLEIAAKIILGRQIASVDGSHKG